MRLIHRYMSVFERPSGLHPERNVEMNIEFEKDAKPKMDPYI